VFGSFGMHLLPQTCEKTIRESIHLIKYEHISQSTSHAASQPASQGQPDSQPGVQNSQPASQGQLERQPVVQPMN
jgi:hypothetical protein